MIAPNRMSNIVDMLNLSRFGEKVVCPWTSVSLISVWNFEVGVGVTSDVVVRKVDAVVLSWIGSTVINNVGTMKRENRKSLDNLDPNLIISVAKRWFRV